MSIWGLAIVLSMFGLLWLNAVAFARPYTRQWGEQQTPHWSERTLNSVLTVFFSAVLFLAQVGAFARAGLPGIVDPFFLELLWAGPAGYFLSGQLVFAGLIGLMRMLREGWLYHGVYGFAGIVLLYAYSAFGHAGPADLWVKLSLGAHLAIALLWFGSLPALYRLCHETDVPRIRKHMERFGNHMAWLVPILVVSGLLALRGVTDQWLPTLPLNSYEGVLVAKLGVVMLVFLLALIHKLFLVPRLTDDAARQTLQRSIGVEIGFASLVLLLVAVLTTSVSP